VRVYVCVEAERAGILMVKGDFYNRD
jgi:hypothetical protein